MHVIIIKYSIDKLDKIKRQSKKKSRHQIFYKKKLYYEKKPLDLIRFKSFTMKNNEIMNNVGI